MVTQDETKTAGNELDLPSQRLVLVVPPEGISAWPAFPWKLGDPAFFDFLVLALFSLLFSEKVTQMYLFVFEIKVIGEF